MDLPPWEYIGTGRVTLLHPKLTKPGDFPYYIRDLPTASYGIDGEHIYVSDKLARAKRSSSILDLVRAKEDQERRLGVINGTYDSGLGRSQKPRVIKSAAE